MKLGSTFNPNAQYIINIKESGTPLSSVKFPAGQLDVPRKSTVWNFPVSSSTTKTITVGNNSGIVNGSVLGACGTITIDQTGGDIWGSAYATNVRAHEINYPTC
eukprot:TRINITY_DN2393_c0_g2_i1.p1 TRINITY_DN2393_c0_g2~~TRINITY_DN2393_c0_g2_i1.p1  ORF type:complete len:104 (-),score=22.50 TRINITY_DN2393_c0_g2_i1:68-379(-)